MWFGVDAQLEHFSVEAKASAALEAEWEKLLCQFYPYARLVALRNAGYQQSKPLLPAWFIMDSAQTYGEDMCSLKKERKR